MFEKELNALRLERDADMEAVRKAYIKMTRRYPPEHFPEKFKQIKQAFERLTLQPLSLQPRIKEFSEAKDENSLLQALIQEALETQQGQDYLDLEVNELAPILDAARHKEELKNLLAEIQEQGLEYKSRPDEAE